MRVASNRMGSLFDLHGRIIVITGGLGRLGQGFARRLAEHNGRVAVVDVVGGAEAAERFGVPPIDPAFLFLAGDVSRRASLEEAVRAISRHWADAPFGLVNAAAIDVPPDASAEENGPFETYPEHAFDRVMEVNVKGVVLACQVFGGRMAEAGRGSIVNVASIYGMVSPDQSLYAYRRESGEIFYKPAAYALSKSALFNLTRYLATYWGKRGVRVNTVSFGGVFDNQHPAFLKEYERRVPLGRMARPGEYDGAIVFLLSEASSYMTGANLVLDGGFTAW